ncbi:MAG: glycosyltransferase [Lacinutrix sp.]|uniref:glycosyltransferase n=1 Tax=Lacinutrix sp. TaxID=1937692 RepID=UPI00309F0E2A
MSLVKEGYQVILIVSDGFGNESVEGVRVLDLGKAKGRISNFINSYFAILKLVKKLNPDLVHFHDAELMIVGKAIQKRGIPVFYDVHENVSAQILDKQHLKSYLRKPLHYAYRITEKLLINNFHLILAEDSYNKIYSVKGKSVTTVLNLPENDSFKDFIKTDRVENGVFYIGGVSNERGLDITIKALHILKKRKISFFMHYIGAISNSTLSKININGIEDNIKFYGRMDLMKGYGVSKKCKVGLAVLKPTANYVESYPTKIFEYMSVKLPVITSNFPLYQAVVERHNVGFCIDPFSAEELADKIEILLMDDSLVKTMGENGIKAVLDQFNSKHEEIKLFNIYKKVLNKSNVNL